MVLSEKRMPLRVVFGRLTGTTGGAFIVEVPFLCVLAVVVDSQNLNGLYILSAKTWPEEIPAALKGLGEIVVSPTLCFSRRESPTNQVPIASSWLQVIANRKTCQAQLRYSSLSKVPCFHILSTGSLFIHSLLPIA
jgi:hypothetical protein